MPHETRNWVPQTDVWSSQPNLTGRTNYLGHLRDEIRKSKILENYFNLNPDGVDYTLIVFKYLKKDRVRRANRNFDRAKQDIGLLVPQLLNDIFKRERVSTERSGRAANARPNEDKETPWLTKYTRHKVKKAF